MPFKTLLHWLDQEKCAGAPNPAQAVLSTVTKNNTPHSRIIAIREISNDSFIFFTQKGTRKVQEIEGNPNVSLCFWLELAQQEMIIEGHAEKLSSEEINQYWVTYPRTAQLRFCAYAEISSQPVASKQMLRDKQTAIEKQFQDKIIPQHPLYIGYRIKPIRFLFYAYRLDELSDVIEYMKDKDDEWQSRIMSP
jgi:pyridoxamine 5'-phosphate oxidase